MAAGVRLRHQRTKQGSISLTGGSEMLLKPAPVSTGQFSYDASTSTFAAEISSTHGLDRVYNDSCDLGLTLVSTRTGREIVFVVEDELRDRENDVLSWSLKAVDAPFKMILWND